MSDYVKLDRIVTLLDAFPEAKAHITKELGHKMPKIPVTVYTKSNCQQCEMTKKQMDRFGIEYTVVDLEANPEILNDFVQKGYTAAPIVTTDTKIWSGFRLEKIKSLGDYIKLQK